MLPRLVPYRIGFVLLLVLAAMKSPAQNWRERLRPEILEIKRYFPDSFPEATFLAMDFARSEIRNPEAWRPAPRGIVRVDIVLTKYPRNLGTWEIGYDTLMEQRLRQLAALIPAVRTTPELRWRVLLQTEPQDLVTAQQMPHGIAVYRQAGPATASPLTSPISEALRPPRFDSVRLRENLDVAQKLLRGTRQYHDSTAIKVLTRIPPQNGATLVIDWTASMYQHGAQTLGWLRSGPYTRNISEIFLFNDGDGQYDDEKVIGSTGGIYVTQLLDSVALDRALLAVTLGGEGGDHRENDLEAVLAATQSDSNPGEIVLIADNSGPVRDLSLLPQINRPLRIVLCGVYHEEIHPDYLTIAHFTQGSIHTAEQDYLNIGARVKYGRLTLGDTEYELRGKRFFKLPKY
ncbi:MAG: hypothetical protein AAF998_15265 [Bacteroidota bacterium]